MKITSAADPGCLSQIRIFSIPDLTRKIVSKPTEMWSGLFIPDPKPDHDFLHIPDPGSRGQKGYRISIPDPKHWKSHVCLLKAGFGSFRPQEVLRLQEEWKSRSLELDKARQDLEEQRGRLAADRKPVLWNRNRRNRLTEPEP